MGTNHVEGISLVELLKGCLFTGCGTISVTVEWTLVEILRNPEVMRKLRAELDQALGPPKRDLEEAAAYVDAENKLTQLPYLNAVIQETMRFHPPTPLLVPHATSDSAVALGPEGFLVPPHTTIVMNTWVLSQDPTIWFEPMVFRPERFLNGEVDAQRTEMAFVPFGAGSRACPAIAQGEVMVRLLVGLLVHSFEWSLPDPFSIAEKASLVVGPLHPLEPYVFPR
eukprot:TRINITY_DN39052_c0_g1_i1.p1 TRINITY_DN39052_c0_g1~~TRINITY_DN39052_c0_g1_i1.p1  ORF type:complete len:239 (+),score=16.46 TRINITY_DN39052_c0_g1_i1:43-717(+)